ncbi:MAG TPA: hypothetical protein PLM49_01420 [Bacteroidales bacterium]|nr:hypothetical protein [Bacteroidales bacterium]
MNCLRKYGFVWGIPLILFCIGLLLQILIGDFRIDALAFPRNVLLLIQFILIVGAAHVLFRKRNWFKQLSQFPTALSSIAFFGAIVMAMAFIPQTYETSFASIHALNNTWLFAFSLMYLLTVLLLVQLRRLFPLNRRNLLFFLGHFGVWIAIAASALGQSDKRQGIMTVPVGELVWFAGDNSGKNMELPFALTLERFQLENHPAKLAIINTRGDICELKGNSLHEAGQGLNCNIGSYVIQVKSYYRDAVIMGDSIVPEAMGYGSDLALVEVLNHTDKPITGYISSGGPMQSSRFLQLGHDTMLVLLPPEPSYFGSDVLLYTQSGLIASPQHIAVNAPIKAEGWYIYQQAYDQNSGKNARFSVFLVVRDPWLPLVYIGIVMMMLAAIVLLFQKPKYRVE